MNPALRQPVVQARRRMLAQALVRRTLACWTATGLLAAAAIAAPKLVPLPSLPAAWASWWLVGGLGAGVAAAAVGTWLRPVTLEDAAEEIDRRFQLSERVASSWTLGEAAHTPAGQALLHDAARVVGRLPIAERFGLTWEKNAWRPLLPMAAAVGMALLVDNRAAQSTGQDAAAATARSPVERAAQALQQRLAQRKQEAAEQGLLQAEELLREVQDQASKLAGDKPPSRQQALVELNDLARRLAERRERLGDGQTLRQELAGMKPLAEGPAEKFGKALQQGDWRQAARELQRLQEQIEQGRLDESQRQALGRQIEQLAQMLQQASAAREQAQRDVARQMAALKRDGKLADAAPLQEKLDNLQKQQAQSRQMQQLAQAMGQLQQALGQDAAQNAEQALKQLSEQVSQLEQQRREGELLENARQQIAMAKDAVACSECQGEGCEQCQSASPQAGSQVAGSRQASQPESSPTSGQLSGQGSGEGRGEGFRPDEQSAVGFRDSELKQQPGKGSSVVEGEAEGGNVKGDVRAQAAREIEAAEGEGADPLVIEQLPRTRRQHVEEYFNLLREGGR